MTRLFPDITMVQFAGADGNRLVADAHTSAQNENARSVLLAHGGGQTRHSWASTATALASRGWQAFNLDQRGHGESDWVECGNYSFAAFGADLAGIADQLVARGLSRPALVGASLGGLSAIIAQGESEREIFSALVLVDVTPRMKPDGIERILDFMASCAGEGFASVDEAADAVANYLPHRPRPKDTSGLAKNLRKGADGRYRWHWDPRFLESRRDARGHAREIFERAESAARALRLPVLLVRGRESELVGEEEIAAFLKAVPHAEFVDVSGARHMVAGDRNDIFNDAVLNFLTEDAPDHR